MFYDTWWRVHFVNANSIPQRIHGFVGLFYISSYFQPQLPKLCPPWGLPSPWWIIFAGPMKVWPGWKCMPNPPGFSKPEICLYPVGFLDTAAPSWRPGFSMLLGGELRGKMRRILTHFLLPINLRSTSKPGLLPRSSCPSIRASL